MHCPLVSIGVFLSRCAAVRSVLRRLQAAWDWWFEDHDRQRRRVNRIVSMSKRRYAGRRFAWLRQECHITVVLLVDFWRLVPKTERFIAAGGFFLILGYTSTWIFLPWATVRGRRALVETLDAVDGAEIIDAIKDERYMGRHGYSPRGMWRAYLASFVLGLPSINALIRELEDDPELRLTCGLGDNLPHRTTFNRFIRRLSRHQELVDRCMAKLTDQLGELLPGLGDEVAVDSTAVRSHSNPNKTSKVTGGPTDPDAGWTAKNSASAKGGKEWYWGYKLHLMVDANYGVPIYGYTTPANMSDVRELPRLMTRATKVLPWLNSKYVVADKGYDSKAAHENVKAFGGVLISPARRAPNAKLYEGIYTSEGVPTCLGMVPMEYVRSDPERGHLYRCPREGCHLKGRTGAVRYCNDEVWENRNDNPRLFGPLRQQSQVWKNLYAKRQTVEQVNKSLKESRRLERHYVRRLANMALHIAMSVLAYSATVLVNVLAGEAEPRWQVRKVA